MRKFLLFITSAFFVAGSLNAQIIPVVNENFDGTPPYQLTTSAASPSLGSTLFATTTQVAFTQPNSMFARVALNDTIYLTSQPFSTVGRAFARLKFNHIAKISAQQRGRVQISTNNGATWQSLTTTQYLGNSTGFPGTGYFNELSYGLDWGTPTFGTLPGAQPNNTWWKEEIFDITNLVIGPGGSGPGFPQVRIRFAAEYAQNSGLLAAGWFIDDVLVEVSDCEIFEPFVSFTHATTAPLQPIGSRFQPSEQVRIGAWDNVALQYVRLSYRLNNGPWIDTAMTNLGPAAPDTTLFNFFWNGLVNGDTIDWYITVADTCNNISRRPSALAVPDYYTFWKAPAPPLRCGLTFPTSFPFLVNTFPWTEDFESSQWVPGTGNGATGGTAHRGNMPIGNPPNGLNYVVSPNLNQIGYGWSVRSGATPTANTGPNSNNTQGGQKYVFADASQVSNPTSPQPQFITPCIQVPPTGCYALEFYYHMFGADINRLRVDIDSGDVNKDNPFFVNGASLIIGQQNSSSTDPWKRGFIPLEQYAGKTIRLRFFAVRVGNNPLADIAIDDLRIYQPPQFDVAVSDISAPEDGFCTYTAQTPVKLRVQNIGCSSLPAVPLAFNVNGTTVWDTLPGPFPSGGDTIYEFVPRANLSANIAYNIRAWGNVANDASRANDTTTAISVNHPVALTTFPYLENFDGTGWNAGNIGTPTTVGTFNTTTGWEPNPAGGGNYHFRVGRYLSPGNQTGPRADYSLNGNYIYAAGNIGTAPGAAAYESRCLNLQGMNNPVFEFAYHLHGANVGQLRVEVIEPGSRVWTTVPGSILNSQQQTAVTQSWRWMSVPLTQYANQTIRIRVVASKNGTGTAADMALDNLRLYNRIASDAGVIDIQRPAFGIETTNTLPMLVVVRNFGLQPVTSIPVTVTITPDCGPNQGVAITSTATWTGNLGPNNQVAVQIPVPASGYPRGSFSVCATTNVAGDNTSFNNQYCNTSSGFEEVEIPFFTNFDPCSGDEYGFFAGNVSGGSPTLRLFEHGTPPSGAASTPFAWNTNRLVGSYRPQTQEVLRVPPVYGFDTVRGTEIRVRHRFSFGSGDGGVLELLNAGTWSTYGNTNLGDNWYGSTSFGAVVVPGIGTPGWVGNTGGQYVLSTYPLGALDRTAGSYSFRFRLNSSNNSSGGFWNIDDVEVYVPPQNSAAPIQIEPLGFFLIPGIDNTLRVRIQNTGANPLDSVVVQYSINGQPYTAEELLVFNPPLLRNAITPWIPLRDQWINPQSGAVNICVITKRPNGKPDDFTPDDTLCVQDVVLDEAVVDANTSYCNDFENPALLPWITYNAFIKGGTTTWEFGQPNQGSVQPLTGNPNAWMTGLTTDYNSRDSSALFTPVFQLSPQTVYKMTFQHNYLTERYHDGGTVEVTFDGGAQWWSLGWPGLTNWYNTPHVTGLEIVKAGWSGNSGGWIPAELNFMVDSNVSVVFRFRMGSDFTLQDAGWAIDDFCLAVTNDMPQYVVSTNDVKEVDFGIGNITPNPAVQTASVPFLLKERSELDIKVTNLLGQVIFEERQTHNAGQGSVNFDVSSWTAGTYFITIIHNGVPHVKKLNVVR